MADEAQEPRSLAGRVMDFMSSPEVAQSVVNALSPLGAEFDALFREGLKDAQTLFMGEWGVGVNEPGTPGNLTSQMITESFEGSYEDRLAAMSPDVGVQAPEMPSVGVQAPEMSDVGVQAPAPMDVGVQAPEMEM